MSRQEAAATKKSMINKNKQMIDKIKTDADRLKQQLCLDLIQQSSSSDTSEIIKLQKEGDQFASKIEEENKKLMNLDIKIAEMNEILKLQREQSGGVQGSKESNIEITKKVKNIEVKLDKCLEKYNDSSAKNKRLRDQIDNLRKHRVFYDRIFKDLECEFKTTKKEMRKTIKKREDVNKLKQAINISMENLKLSARREQDKFDED